MINSYVALDLETTGLNPVTDEILEIGAVKVVDNKPVAEYETFVLCTEQIKPEIVRLTGITQKMADSGIDIGTALKELFEFCEDYIILGHNIQFDFSFLKAKAKQNHLNYAAQSIDTLRIAKKVLPKLESRSLSYLVSYYQIPVSASHRALEDAKSAMKLYQIFQETYGSREELFKPAELIFKMKKESPATPAQKGYLKDLLEYHKIEIQTEMSTLTKSEASKLIDSILLKHGKIKRKYHS